MIQANTYVLIIRLVLATILGGAVGLERELHGRAAGLRTHILVCLGSCLIIATAIFFSENYGADAGKIAAGVVTGIGFLGAGTIMRYRASVIGLTTAASIWTVSAIGLAVGCGFYPAAFWTTLIALVTLALLTRVERKWLHKEWLRLLKIETKGELQQLGKIRQVFSQYRAEVRDLEISKIENTRNYLLEIQLRLPRDSDEQLIITEIMRLEGVEKARWE